MRGLLLDTSILLFVILRSDRLGGVIRSAMQARPRFVSTISAAEIAIKINTGRLSLPTLFDTDFASAFRTVVDDLGGALIHPEVEDFARLARLPLIHRDPFDRILISQAFGRDLTVVTSDGTFHRYGLEVLQIP